MFKDRRLGTIRVDLSVIEDNPEVVKQMMSSVIVVRAELMYQHAGVEYTCLCDDFEELPDGATVPEYNVEVEEADGALTFSFAKAE